MNFVWPLISAFVGTAFLALFFRRYRVTSDVAIALESLVETPVLQLRDDQRELAAALEENRAHLKEMLEIAAQHRALAFEKVLAKILAQHQALMDQKILGKIAETSRTAITQIRLGEHSTVNRPRVEP